MNKQKTEIIELLNHKQKICAQLLKKMSEQMDAVSNKDETQLAVIIEDKEGLIGKLNETDKKIADLADELDEATRQALVQENGGLAKSIESDLEKIIEQETTCQAKLDIVKTEVVQKIKGIRKGQELLKGYGVSQRIKPKISKNV